MGEPGGDDAVRRQPGERLPRQRDPAGAGLQQPGNDAHQGRLAGAVRPDHRDGLAELDREVDAEQGLERAVAGVDRGERQRPRPPRPPQ